MEINYIQNIFRTMNISSYDFKHKILTFSVAYLRVSPGVLDPPPQTLCSDPYSSTKDTKIIFFILNCCTVFYGPSPPENV